MLTAHGNGKSQALTAKIGDLRVAEFYRDFHDDSVRRAHGNDLGHRTGRIGNAPTVDGNIRKLQHPLCRTAHQIVRKAYIARASALRRATMFLYPQRTAFPSNSAALLPGSVVAYAKVVTASVNAISAASRMSMEQKVAPVAASTSSVPFVVLMRPKMPGASCQKR